MSEMEITAENAREAYQKMYSLRRFFHKHPEELSKVDFIEEFLLSSEHKIINENDEEIDPEEETPERSEELKKPFKSWLTKESVQILHDSYYSPGETFIDVLRSVERVIKQEMDIRDFDANECGQLESALTRIADTLEGKDYRKSGKRIKKIYDILASVSMAFVKNNIIYSTDAARK